MALTIGMPTMRLVDASKFGLAGWQKYLVINKDQPVKEFRLDLSDDDLGDLIHDAVKVLANKAGRGR